MLRRYRSDPSHVISMKEIELQSDLTYEEEPIRILAREVKELRNKQIPLVKVLWRHHNTEEAKRGSMGNESTATKLAKHDEWVRYKYFNPKGSNSSISHSSAVKI